MKQIFGFLIFFITSFNTFAQTPQNWWQKHIELGGYVKYLNTMNFHDGQDLLTDNLWHNRINFHFYIDKHISFNAGLRNRVFYGDLIKNPFYRQSLAKNEGIVSLTKNIIDEPNILMLSNLDRLNVDYTYQNLELTLGRQRINWGKNLVWNPNDIFNTANFLDMDYEEKPGTDALRLRYNIGEMSQLDVAYTTNKAFETDQSILALAFHSVYKSYDYQLIAAKYFKAYMLGLGWEGNLKNFGFKGESSYFIDDSKNVFVSSISLDYAFKNGTNWMISGLYNGGFDTNNPLGVLSLLNTRLDAKNLFPSRWAFYNQFSGNFAAAWHWSFGTVYGTQNRLTVLIPQIQYSITNNWDMDIFAQSFFADIPNIRQRNIFTFRLQYSF